MTDWITQLKLKELEQQHGLPGGLLGAVMQQESGGNPNAVSPKGAQGLFQFMPETAQAYGIDPYDPQQAAIGAARMYGDLSKQYGGDLNKMLAGYNWGSGNMERHGMENMPEETRNYIANITQALQSQGNMNPALPQGVQVADAGTTMSDAPNPMTGQPTEAEIDAEIQALEAELGIVPTQAAAPAEDEAAIDAEIAKLEAELGISGDAAPAQEPDFLTRVGQSLSERGRQGKEILDAASRGEQTDFESMLQLIGKPIAGTINDAIGGGLNLAGKGLSAITPDFIEDPLMAKLSSLAGTGAETASPAIERLTKAYSDFAKDSPRAARNIEAIANIGMVAPVAKPLAVGAKAAAETTGKAAKAAGQAAASVTKPITKGIAARGADELELATKEMFDRSRDTYKAAKETRANIKPEKVSSIVNDVTKAIEDVGELDPELHKDILGRITRLNSLADKGEGLTLEAMDNQRKLLAEVVSKNTVMGKPDGTALRATRAIEALDDAVEALGDADIVGSGKEAFEALTQARKQWSSAKKFETVSDILRKAEGDPVKIKSGLSKILQDKRKSRGFSKEEIDALKTAAKTTVPEGLLRQLGKFGAELPTSANYGRALLPLGGMYFGGLPLTAAGTVARAGEKYLARGKAEDLLKVIEGYAPSNKSATALERMSKYGRKVDKNE